MSEVIRHEECNPNPLGFGRAELLPIRANKVYMQKKKKMQYMRNLTHHPFYPIRNIRSFKVE